jgi:hypothetical protein
MPCTDGTVKEPAHDAGGGRLGAPHSTDVVELNHAAALAETGDVRTALELVDRLDLDHCHYLHATRAELLRRLDRLDDARSVQTRARTRPLSCRAPLPRTPPQGTRTVSHNHLIRSVR